MNGPGKYDDLCTKARKAAKARGAILIIHQGSKGSGFSVQAPALLMASIPSMLRYIADEIEKDMQDQERA